MTIAAGIAVFATPASAATSDITGITITPTAATTSTGANTCQSYTVTVAETAGHSGDPITVALQPTGAIDSQFCGPANNATVGNGSQDVLAGAVPTGASNTYTFGVNEANATAAPGTIQIKAFPQNGTSGTPAAGTAAADVATATQTVVTATTQNDAVTALAVTSGDNQVVTEGGTATYKVQATNGAASDVQGATVTGTVTSSQGSPTGSAVTCSTTNATGVSTCTLPAPSTIPTLQTGPYTVTFSVARGGTAGAVTATAHLVTAPPAPGTATVDTTCGTSATERTNSSTCFEPTSASSDNFTATVTTPDTSAGAAPGATNPVVGVQVTFTRTGGTSTDTSSIAPTTCLTGPDGSCSATLTYTGTPAQGDEFHVTATVSTGASDTATVTFDNNFTGEPTNVSVSAADASPVTGSDDLITAQVANQFGSASGAGETVFFTASNGGRFTNGGSQTTGTTGLNGQAQASLTDGTAESVTVTASLDPAGDCTTTGGQCSDSTTVTFTKPVSPPPSKKKVEKPTLTLKSKTKGHLTVHTVTHPSLSHQSMHFFKVSKHGNRHLLGVQATGSGGHATRTFKLEAGKKYRIQVRIVHDSHVISKFSKIKSEKVKK